MTGPIVLERQATGCRVRVEARNPRRTPGGALAVDMRVTMYGESIAGTVVLLAGYGPPWVSAHGHLLAAIRALPSGTYLEVAEVIEDVASKTVGALYEQACRDLDDAVIEDVAAERKKEIQNGKHGQF